LRIGRGDYPGHHDEWRDPLVAEVGGPGGDADGMAAEDEQALGRTDGNAQPEIIPENAAWPRAPAVGVTGLGSLPGGGWRRA